MEPPKDIINKDIKVLLEGLGRPEHKPSRQLSIETIDAPAWFDTFQKIQKGELPRRGFLVGEKSFNDETIKGLTVAARVVGGTKDKTVSFGLSATLDYSESRLEKDAGFTPTGDSVRIANILREQGNNVTFESTGTGQQIMLLEKDGIRCRINLGWSSPKERPVDIGTFDSSSWRRSLFDMGNASFNSTTPGSPNTPIEIELVNPKNNNATLEITNPDDMTKHASEFAHMLQEFTTAYYEAKKALPPGEIINLQLPDWEKYVGDNPILASVASKDAAIPTSLFDKLFGGGSEQIGTILTDDQKKEMPTFADIGGQPQAVEEAKRLVMVIKHAEQYALRSAPRPKGILLEGPPGTGKTMLAKAIAKEAGAEFMSLSITDVISKWLGDAEKRMQTFFDQAKILTEEGKDVIVFVDEVDGLIPSRDSNVHEATRKMVNVFLENMDGLKTNPRLTILAATNRAESLDEAFTRPGRLDKKIHVGLPDTKGRRQIFKIHLKNHLQQAGKKDDLISPDLDLDLLVQQIGNVSGADIAAIINLALEEKVTADIRFLEGDTQNGRPWSPLTVDDLLASRIRYIPQIQERPPMGFSPRKN